MNNRIGKNNKEVNNKRPNNKEADRKNVRAAADNITDMLDEQAIKNFEINLQINKYKSELRHALQQLDEHTYCPSQVDIQCDNKSTRECSASKKEVLDEDEEVHGADCHCSKCCPNPNPNFFKKHKFAILLGVLWVAIIILALGISPSGAVFETIQNSWVELIVNFFKMGLFAIAGIATYNLVKKDE